MSNATFQANLVPVAHQRIRLANSTAVGLNTTVRGCSYLRLSVETQAGRYRDDGTDPTLTTGILLAANSLTTIEGFNGTSQFKLQRSTGVCVVNVAGYKLQGTKAY